jgi:hypothetical protein
MWGSLLCLKIFFNPDMLRVVLSGCVNQENTLYWSLLQIQVFERCLPNSSGENRGRQVLAGGAALTAKLCDFTELLE